MLKALPPGKWDFSTAAHLLNRAGFGGTPAQIDRLAGAGPAQAVSWLVDYETVSDSTPAPAWAHPDPDRAEKLREARQASPEERRKIVREDQRLQRQRMIELRHWWLQRMAEGPRPFQEKTTLFWHGHFATSEQKVRDAYLMWRQNELFRRLATDNWLRILVETATDPAMLIWLDQAQSRKQHANENFSREVMELFTLGEGHYTEKDVTEGARALTGWSYDRNTQRFIERPQWHDTGIKTFLGRTGNLNGQDVLGQIVAQPQAAKFITAKLWNYFAGETPAPDLNEALASVFRANSNNFKPLMRTMFLSEEFYTPRIIRNQIKSPVQWLVNSVRVLQRELPPPLVCYALTRDLGQDLFAPPNVKGWDGGLAWISTSTLLARYNDANTLVQGDLMPLADVNMAKNPQGQMIAERRLRRIRVGGVDVNRIFTEIERNDKGLLIAALEKCLLQAQLTVHQEEALLEYLNAKDSLDESDIRGAIHLVMSTPEYQLT